MQRMHGVRTRLRWLTTAAFVAGSDHEHAGSDERARTQFADKAEKPSMYCQEDFPAAFDAGGSLVTHVARRVLIEAPTNEN